MKERFEEGIEKEGVGRRRTKRHKREKGREEEGRDEGMDRWMNEEKERESG